MPATSINKMVADKVKQIEQTEGRPVRRKERQQIKEEVIHSILPTALTRTIRTHAYIDLVGGYIAVDTASANRSDEVIRLLRSCVEDMQIHQVNAELTPKVEMAGWVHGAPMPDGWTVGSECELRDSNNEGSIVRCKNQDLLSDEVKSHIDSGKLVTKLGLEWKERLTFVLTDDIVIKRLRFGDVVMESMVDIETEDYASIQDAEFALMTAEIRNLISDTRSVFKF